VAANSSFFLRCLRSKLLQQTGLTRLESFQAQRVLAATHGDQNPQISPKKLKIYIPFFGLSCAVKTSKVSQESGTGIVQVA